MTQRGSRLAALIAAACFFAAGGAPRARSHEAQSARIVAVGDVHGAFDAFSGILQTAGVIDARRQWSGGQTVFVQTGDIFDRGAGVRDSLDLLMRLEGEAKRAGGRVVALLGNHEVMNLIGEYRDVSPDAYAAFADGRSADRQRRAYDDYAKIAGRQARKGESIPSRDEWNKTHPPGFVEYSDALGARGTYGKWLRSHALALTMDGTAFMHAGVNPASAGSLDDINRVAATEIATWDEAKAMMVKAQLVPVFSTLPETLDAAAREYERIAEALKANTAPGDHVTREFVDRLRFVLEIGKSSLLEAQGPLWFRGFAQWGEEEAPQATALLERLGLTRFVTAHTPSSSGRIRSRFGNRIFLIDTGMLSSVYKGGRASALELQGGRATAIYSDAREVLAQPNATLMRRAPLRLTASASR
jgi:hypothetical protein